MTPHLWFLLGFVAGQFAVMFALALGKMAGDR